MLKQPLPSSRRRLAGTAAVCLLASAVAFTAWAAQPTGSTPATSDAESRTLDSPRYPAHAVEQRIEGKVVLIVDIDARGEVQSVEVESADPAGVFEEEAVAAARKWRFNPATEGGVAVASRMRVPVDFAMDPPDGTDGQ